jgi:hypothetical protein
LRRTTEVFLVFGGEEELVVTGYTNVSIQTDTDDSKSQSNFEFCLNGGAKEVIDLMMEAEYIVVSEAAKEVVSIRKFVPKLGVVPSASSPMDLYCDNSGAAAQAKEPRSHKKSKHVL